MPKHLRNWTVVWDPNSDAVGSGRQRAMNVFLRISPILGSLAVTVVAVAGVSDGTQLPSDTDHSPTAVIEISMDDQEPRRIISQGVMVDGVLTIAGEYVDSNRGFMLVWDWKADLDPMGHARLDGEASIRNKSGERHVYDVQASFKLDPVIMNASAVGGSVRVTLEMDADGGILDVPFGDSVWSVMIDDDEVKRLHPGPFMMGGTGSGNAVADANFGAPYPGLVAPSIEEGFRIRHHCRVTSGDRAVFATDLHIGGDPSDFVRRRDIQRPVRIGDRNLERRVIKMGPTPRGRSANGTRRGGVSKSSGSAERGITIRKTNKRNKPGISQT